MSRLARAVAAGPSVGGRDGAGVHSSRSRPSRRRSGLRVAALTVVLLALAGALFAVAWSNRRTPVVVAHGHVGPLSTHGRPVVRALPSVTSPVPATDLRVGLRFVARQQASPSELFALGAPGKGLHVTVGRVAAGGEQVFLVSQLVDGAPVNELLGTIRPGRAARLQLTVRGGKELIAVLDGHRVLTNYPFVEFAPLLSPLRIGGGPSSRASLSGPVERFVLSYRQLRVPVQSAGYRALEAAAGLACVLAALVAVAGVAGLLDRHARTATSAAGTAVTGVTASGVSATGAGERSPETATAGLTAGELEAASRWLLPVAVFLLALCIWWVAYAYFRNPSATYGIGFWNPSDRAGWLPVTKPYYPLVGQHFFGDFFQLYYVIRTHTVYTGRLFHTDLNPGYLLPAAIVAWLPYPAAGFTYVTALLAAWALPAFVIGRARPLLGACYLLGTTLTVPGLMALDLGQPQVFIYVLALGALALLSAAPRTSAVLIGLAIAIKPYMAVYLLVYLLRRRYRDAAGALGLAVALNLVLGVLLGGAHFFSGHVLGQIVASMTSYGSGASLKIWGGQPFLHDNSSLFALFETLRQARAPVAGAIGGALVHHYTIVQVAVGAGLAWLLVARRKVMAIEDQWLLVTIAVLLIPSYSLGYAWLLLLVPLGVRTWRTALDPGRSPVAERARAYLPLLAVVAYPTVIAGAAFPNPAFGPNGNAIATPLLLGALAVAMAWHELRPVSHRAEVGGGTIGTLGRWVARPLGADRAFLTAVACGITLEVAVAAITFGLSGAVHSP